MIASNILALMEWERLEAEREKASQRAEARADRLAETPHAYRESSVVGYCVCRTAKWAHE